MPKSYTGSKTSDLHVLKPCALPENEATLYVKTADIPGVLTIVDVPEKMTVLYAETTDIPGILTLINVPENVTVLLAYPAVISRS